MCPIPIHNTKPFQNDTKMLMSQKVMGETLLKNNNNIAESLVGVPLILRTETSLNYFRDPMDRTKYMAYVSQFKKTVQFRGKSICSKPPYVFNSHSLAQSSPSHLGPDQINLTIIIPIVVWCVWYDKECVQQCIWSAAIIPNKNTTRIRAHAMLYHYANLPSGNLYLSINDSIGGILMTSELFLLGFFSLRFAAEPFSMRTDSEGELITDDATYTSIKSGLGVVMGTWLKNVYGRGHLDNSHVSQIDRLQNCGEFILYSLLSVFVL